ncbi:MAG: GDSL-type esterase/lipase family protein [Stenotrophobium sp.]
MNAPADIRVCFVGDSHVAGTGDPEHRGWVGRVLAQAAVDGIELTAYNLGIRRETSADIARRWTVECARRLPEGCRSHVVFSFGVNDTTIEAGHLRVSAEDSMKYLHDVLDAAKSLRRIAMIGPAPTADAAQNRRIGALSEQFNSACKVLQVPYLPVFEALHKNSVWMRQVAANDGAHPQAEGYAEFARLILGWNGWWFRRAAP